MISEIVLCLPEGMSREDAMAKYRLRVPMWQANPDRTALKNQSLNWKAIARVISGSSTLGSSNKRCTNSVTANDR